MLGPGDSPLSSSGSGFSEKKKRVAEIRARRGRTPKFKGENNNMGLFANIKSNQGTVETLGKVLSKNDKK